MIIISVYIEDMGDYSRTAQEKLNLQVPIPPRYLSIYRAYEIFDIACNVLIPKSYLFMGLHNPYRTWKAQGLGKPNWNRRAYLKGPLSSYLNKEVEKKKNPSSRKFHKFFPFETLTTSYRRKSFCCVSCTLLSFVTKQIL